MNTTKQMYATPGDTGVAPGPAPITRDDREQVPDDERPGYVAPTGPKVTSADREEVPADER